jgi:hypothetical protein
MASDRSTRQSKIDKKFTAILQKSPSKGGWSGTHKLPIKTDVRNAIRKEAGDRVTIRLEKRIA